MLPMPLDIDKVREYTHKTAEGERQEKKAEEYLQHPSAFLRDRKDDGKAYTLKDICRHIDTHVPKDKIQERLDEKDYDSLSMYVADMLDRTVNVFGTEVDGEPVYAMQDEVGFTTDKDKDASTDDDTEKSGYEPHPGNRK